MKKENVDIVAGTLIRKYDWRSEQVNDETVRLTVTDGQEEASVDITTYEDIAGEIDRLIKAVDAHEYTVIG